MFKYSDILYFVTTTLKFNTGSFVFIQSKKLIKSTHYSIGDFLINYIHYYACITEVTFLKRFSRNFDAKKIRNNSSLLIEMNSS